MTSVSVLSLVRGREDHLSYMLRGLKEQTRPPDDIVVALMQPGKPSVDPDLLEGVRLVHVGGESLPLAAARNRAADAAKGSVLAFLDVDCIPHPGFVEAAAGNAEGSRVAMADCRYLGPDARKAAAFGDLWKSAEKHPARQGGKLADPPLRVPAMSELWSLAFALGRDLFEEAGGFDERFTGYGGEDTDFALGLERAGGALFFVPAMRAVHQWHPVRKPPLHHFDDIITNAERFYAKHGQWCMDYWLGQLEDSGYIDWRAGELVVLRRPSADDLEATLQPGRVRFS